MGSIGYFMKYGVYGTLFSLAVKAVIIGTVAAAGMATYYALTDDNKKDSAVERTIDEIVDDSRAEEIFRKNDVERGGNFQY